MGLGFVNLSAVCGRHHHDPRFIYFFYFQVFFNRSLILDPRSSILHPRFPVILEVLLFKIAIVLSFDHGSKKLFQSNQSFQAIEFVGPPVLEKPNMRFLFYGHEVLHVECVIVKYKARKNTSVTHM